MDTKSLERPKEMIVGKLYCCPGHFLLCYQDLDLATDAKTWAEFEGDAFDAMPMYSACPRMFYNKGGEEVIQSVISEIATEGGITDVISINPDQVWMFVGPIIKIDSKRNFEPSWAAQILFTGKTGWILFDESQIQVKQVA